jgi:hypothetical protein
MTYAFAWALQRALYAALTTDGPLSGLLGGRVFDDPPHGADFDEAAGPYALIGEERAEAWTTATEDGGVYAVEIAVIAPKGGFAPAKRAAGRISEVALGPIALEAGRVVSARFLGARALRRPQGGRRVDLRFRFVIEA